jgi:hypothetical protein
MNTGQRKSKGVKELRIRGRERERERVNWLDGCKEYLVTFSSYFYL